jgi:hypothetical protein
MTSIEDKLNNITMTSKMRGGKHIYSITNIDTGDLLVDVVYDKNGYEINNHFFDNNAEAIDFVQQILQGTVLNQEVDEWIIEAERQMEEVRKRYEGTEGWMKAPNGKPTNLNERQWLQVRTQKSKTGSETGRMIPRTPARWWTRTENRWWCIMGLALSSAFLPQTNT